MAPNAAWISGANVSMSGHITITSRGSSVGSSASSCRIASRSTSTWRARPWQEWTCTLRSGSSDGSGAASSRTAAWMRASSVPVAGTLVCRWSARGCALASTSWSSRESWPQDASSGLRGIVAVSSWLRRVTGGWSASRSQRAGEGCSRKRWTSRCSASASSTARRPAGRRVSPNSASRGGRSASCGCARSRAHASTIRSAGPGSGIAASRRRHSSACQPSPPPRAHSRSSSGRCSA